MRLPQKHIDFDCLLVRLPQKHIGVEHISVSLPQKHEGYEPQPLGIIIIVHAYTNTQTHVTQQIGKQL